MHRGSSIPQLLPRLADQLDAQSSKLRKVYKQMEQCQSDIASNIRRDEARELWRQLIIPNQAPSQDCG